MRTTTQKATKYIIFTIKTQWYMYIYTIKTQLKCVYNIGWSEKC